MKRWARYLALTLMLGCAMMANTSPGHSENVSEGENIISLRASYPIPNEFKHESAWAHDNRRFALAIGNEVLIFDTGDPDSKPRSLNSSIGPVADSFIAWSPDDEMIAVSQGSGKKNGVSVYRVADGELLAQRLLETSTEGDLVYREFLKGKGPVTFSLDGKSLWVTRAPLLALKAPPFLYAIRLSLPGLEMQDELKIEPPIEGRPIMVHNVYIDSPAGRPILSLAALANMAPTGAPIYAPFAYAIDLETKTEVFPHFVLSNENRSGFFRSPQHIYVPQDPSFILVRLTPGIETRPGVDHHPEFDRLFEGYDTRKGQVIVTYEGVNGDGPERGAIANSAVLPDGSLTIASWSRFLIDTVGGLVVLETKTGRVRQRIGNIPAYYIWLSPDGRSFAVTKGNHRLEIYSINH
ncbi:MAG: hypothetical protein ACLQKK_16460 [Rhodomicrobium sp.]